MLPINKLDISFNIEKLKNWLVDCDLWGEFTMRGDGEGSPHKDMKDIWVRYRHFDDCIESGDWTPFFEEHESEWLKDIPDVKEISDSLMGYLNGSQLGGILLTKLPAGGKILPHVDGGWHPEYYDKYLIPINNKKGAVFGFEECSVDTKEGDVYAFRNDVHHWVNNNSPEDRIAMIICIKQNKLSKEGLCLGDMH